MQVLVKHVQNRAANTSTKQLDLYKIAQIFKHLKFGLEVF